MRPAGARSIAERRQTVAHRGVDHRAKLGVHGGGLLRRLRSRPGTPASTAVTSGASVGDA